MRKSGTMKVSASNEVTLIAGGVDSIQDHDIPESTHAINFHGNNIRKIDGLSSTGLGLNLRLLDLSSNRIRVIENLDALVNLKSLNLAANLISVVGSGLAELKTLECLNLSYNQISSIAGLRCFAGDSRLRTLMLHGNRLDHLSAVLPVVAAPKSLKILTFEVEGASNPICPDPNYLTQVWAHCPQLSTLDGVTASGAAARDGQKGIPLPEEAEIAELLGFLASEDDDENDSREALNDTTSSDPFQSLTDETVSSSSDTQLNIVRDNYPKIEAVLSQFRKNPIDPVVRRNGKDDNLSKANHESVDKEDAIGARPVSPNPTTAVDETRLMNIERQLHHLLEGRAVASSGDKVESETGQSIIPSVTNVDEGTQTDGLKTSETTEASIKTKATDDAYLRNLLGQLDEEREKRWTAQKKYDDLSIEFHEINEKRAQERKQIEEALTLVHRLQARLDSGKASQRELEKNVDVLTDANEKLQRDVKSGKTREVALQRLSRELQEKANRLTKEKDERIAVVEEELETVTKDAKSANTEVEKLRSQVEELKTLLAEKEKDHQESLRGKYSIGSIEIQTLLTKEGDRISETYKMQVDTWKSKYQDLEDEFRLALHLEADRFSALQDAEEKLRMENAKINTALKDLVAREARASSLVKELSDLAKEQKNKMAEMAKNHQNVAQSLKKKYEVTEASLSTARERLKTMDELTSSKAQLETRCAALETLVKNVKAEKELWSSELAQQGAALSQDRGRLEAKVEALTAEVASLKKQLERDADSLRIKGKVIDDQTESIKKLKDGLLDRDRRIKENNDDHLAKEKESNRRLEEEIQNRAAAEERIEYLEGRKEELKREIAAAEEEATGLKSNNEKLIQKWKDRSKLIESLEVKVAEMKRNWDEKEAALTRERDAAVAEKEELRANSAAIDAAFRSQLDQARAAHARELREMEDLKDLEINEARNKLVAAEDEMREILQEAAEHKSQMQRKIKNLTSAFAELQN